MNRYPKKGKTITAKNVYIYRVHTHTDVMGRKTTFDRTQVVLLFQQIDFLLFSRRFVLFHFILSSPKHENKIDRDVDGYIDTCMYMFFYFYVYK